MSSIDNQPFPKAALLGAGLLILTTVAGVGTIQLRKHLAHLPLVASDIQLAAPIQVRSLRFIDQKDGVAIYGGHVRVFDAATNTELAPLGEREGFVRAVLNSLSYERDKNSLSAPPVFELTRWSDNKITITDKVTGTMINLGDFGNGNKSAFLRFLAPLPSRS